MHLIKFGLTCWHQLGPSLPGQIDLPHPTSFNCQCNDIEDDSYFVVDLRLRLARLVNVKVAKQNETCDDHNNGGCCY